MGLKQRTLEELKALQALHGAEAEGTEASSAEETVKPNAGPEATTGEGTEATTAEGTEMTTGEETEVTTVVTEAEATTEGAQGGERGSRS